MLLTVDSRLSAFVSVAISLAVLLCDLFCVVVCLCFVVVVYVLGFACCHHSFCRLHVCLLINSTNEDGMEIVGVM